MARVYGFFRRAHRDGDMNEEFAAHLALETDELVRRGMSPSEARRLAMVHAGGLEAARDAYRDQRGLPWVQRSLTEVASATKRLRRHPGAVGGASLSLALGMALATAVFSMVVALFLRPLPFPNQAELVIVRERDPQMNSLFSVLPARDALAAQQVHSFSGVAVAQEYGPGSDLGSSGHAIRVASVPVTSNYFDVLGVRPLLGRMFTEDDAHETVPPVILSYSVWHSEFGGSSDVIGSTVPVDGRLAMIVGVMPPGFSLPLGTDIWLPFGHDSLQRLAMPPANRKWQNNVVIARLRPGVTMARAQADVSVAFHQAGMAAGLAKTPVGDLLPLAQDVTSPYRNLIRLWIAAALVIILLGAVNFATLLLARGMRRREEIAVRIALGASRRRIAGMLTVEATLMAAIGGAVAVVLAKWLLDARRLWFGMDFMLVAPSMNWATVAFGVAGTVLVGLLFGLAPAIDLARADLRSVLSGASSSTGGSREVHNRRGLVALQLGLSLACMAMLAALVVANRDAQGAGPGYDYSHVLTARLNVPDTAASQEIGASLVQAIEGVPGVQSAAVVRTPILGAALFYPDWRPHLYAAQAWKDVSLSYFRTLGLTPILGRLPTAAEAEAHAPVVVLSKSTARWTFGDRPPVGRRVGLALDGSTHLTWFSVIGVVPDVRDMPNFDPLTPPIYTVQRLPLGHTTTEVRIRTVGDAATGLRAVKEAVGRIDPRIVVSDLDPVAAVVDQWSAQARARTYFFAFMAALSFVLAVAGVYGLTSYSVALRAREIGIRVALGATPRRLVRALVADLGTVALLATLGGLLLGSRAVYIADTYLRNPLAGKPALTMQLAPVAVVAVTLLVVMALGMALPIRRMLRQDVVRSIQGDAG